MLHRRTLLGFVAVLLAIPAAELRAQDGHHHGGGRSDVPAGTILVPDGWSEEALDVAARIPVQEGGRLKPLSTVAGFSLLRINHRRSTKDASGQKLTPLEWLLNALLYPDHARRQEIFLVQNRDVLDALGLNAAGKKRRDRYTYDELLPARRRLLQLSHEYAQVDEKKRSPVQGQIVHLAQNFLEFEGLVGYLDFARATIKVDGIPALKPLFGGRSQVRVSQALQRLPELVSGGKETAVGAAHLRQQLKVALKRARSLALLPPMSEEEDAAWLTPLDIFVWARTGRTVPDVHLEGLRHLEDLVRHRGNSAELQQSLASLHQLTSAVALNRGVYDKIEMEVSFYGLDPFYRSLLIYLVAFLLVAVTWLKPGKWLTRSAVVLLGGGLTLHTVGIVMRCLIRGRPPVSTLYETVLFITAVAVAAALVVEVINRRRIGLAAAPVLGVIGLFVANRFEAVNRADTMPQLVAVLDTNFWLATHVTTITIGYAAALLAAAIAHVHVVGRALGLKRDDPTFYRNISKMVYGVICFALLFSTVGTILGGVWANDSWGRFWGWDPKENGALLIVLSQLALLHGRMGGYLRDHGICMAAIFGGIVVSFSWWGVNLLGVGLHSYGFTSGVWTGLLVFYGVEGFVLLVGAVSWLRSRTESAAAAA